MQENNPRSGTMRKWWFCKQVEELKKDKRQLIPKLQKEELCPAHPVYVRLVLPPLDSETGWTGELWSKNNLLK